MKSFRPKKTDLRPDYIVIDFDDLSNTELTLGRVCAKIAKILRGKHKPIFTPGTMCGDRVILLNSDKLQVTGKKLTDNIYYKHTGYVGNMKKMSLEERMERDSREVVRLAVKRMLPRGPLGRSQMRMLHIYNDGQHNYHSVKSSKFTAEDLRRI